MITLYGFPEQQLPLPLDLPVSIFTRRTLGLLGELSVQREFTRQGFRAERARVKNGDVRIIDERTGESFTIEVKTSRLGKAGYQFCLYRELPRGVCADYRHADYVVLIALVGDGTHGETFVIPTSDIAQHQISFRNPLTTAKFGRYRRDLSLEALAHA